MELVGERWSLLIVRELMFGGRRFSDLRGGLPGISAKVLTERLQGLEQAGIVQRRQLAPPAPAQLYELTPWGYRADEAIMALGRWAALSSRHDPTLPLSPASFMLSLRTMFDAERAGDLTVTAAISIGAADRFVARIETGRFSAARAEPQAPDFAFAAPVASPIALAIYAGLPFDGLGAAGLVVEGDRALALRFIDCFNLPEKVG